MAEQATRVNGHRNGASTARTPYEEATLGFRNYWYPVFSSREVTTKPKGVTLLGDKLVLMRNQGKVYAMTDECAHRGTQLSIGRGCEFPGTATITCPYHGWTYDLKTGACVAVLPEGPESAVPGKVRMRTYPVEERKGIVWIWMGSGAPVPLEEDVPKLILREGTIAKFRHNIQYGNWRWHAENVNAGHAQMIHRDSPKSWFSRPFPERLPGKPEIKEDLDGKGVDNGLVGGSIMNTVAGKMPPIGTEFPGLGRWYVPPLWRRVLFYPWLHRRRNSRGRDVQGISTFLLMLPGLFRVPNFPSDGNIYYEWYVPVDEEHYIYAQVTALFGTNKLARLWRQLWYHLWGKLAGPILFNNQDIRFVAQTTNYVKRHRLSRYPMVKFSRNDDFHTLWRQYVNETARGVGYADRRSAQPADAEPVAGAR